MTSTWAIRCVWQRYFAVYQKNIFYGIVTTFVEPILYLLAFGYGMGSMVDHVEVHGMRLSYRQFIFAGIVSQTILFQAFFEAAYGSFIRMYYQKIFQGIATTPITLSEILWGELIWDASKATFATLAVLILGSLTGDFHVSGAILLIPITFFCSLLFAAMGLWVSATAKTIESISYPQYLLIFPMFLFCGVFYPVENLPQAFQAIAWILPLTAVNSLVRTLTLGFPLQIQALPILFAWFAVLVIFSRRAMMKRLVK